MTSGGKSAKALSDRIIPLAGAAQKAVKTPWRRYAVPSDRDVSGSGERRDIRCVLLRLAQCVCGLWW